MERVLFSPIGMTDPTRYNYDGPFLHILRHYKPQKAYIFLTAEMWRYHIKDDRFRIMARKVCPTCEVIPLDYSFFNDPHRYMEADRYVKEALKRVIDENPDSEILINISSSTPQMTSPLYALAASAPASWNLKLIQVETPLSKGNSSRDDYDIEKEWANLLDNKVDEKLVRKRCFEVTPENIRLQIACENIKKHIKAYDYSAAAEIAKDRDVRSLISGKAVNLIEAGVKRSALFYPEARELAEKAGYKLASIKIKNSKKANRILEYILYLQIKLEKQEIGDFARGVSPVLTELFCEYLKFVHGMDIISKCCITTHNGVPKLIRSKLPPACLAYYDREEGFGGCFRDSNLAFSNILPMVRYCCDRKPGCDKHLEIAERLREFEKSVRNNAAHQIIGLTEKSMKRDYGFSAREVIDDIKFIFCRTYPAYAKGSLWNSYGDLNRAIEEELDRAVASPAAQAESGPAGK